MDAVASAAALDVALTDNAMRVLQNRYLMKNGRGVVCESPGDMFTRVARCVASVEPESRRSEFEATAYRLMTSGRFMPNSPTLMNAGRSMGQLSACYVVPVWDSTPNIFDAIKTAAIIQKTGGGVGFAFDELRPCGAIVHSSGGMASGPISFWRAFCEATHSIQQGSFRRGANMATMSVSHPDILKFLYAKQDLTQFTNYNISVKVTDEWMSQVRNKPDTPHRVSWDSDVWYVPRALTDKCRACVGCDNVRALDTCYGVHDLVADPSGDVMTIGDIFKIIVEHAHATGEPGLLFLDRVRETEPTPDVALVQTTNPCGEQPLGPYESCNLGSINLRKYVTPFWERFDRFEDIRDRESLVDWTALTADVVFCVRFLNNVIDVNRFPTETIAKACLDNRRIGLGIMGFADMLIRLGLKYDSDDARMFAANMMSRFNRIAISTSQDLAEEHGSFPNYSRSRWATGELSKRYKCDNRPMRNACVTTVAPTGTISIIANCSGGIEPLFSIAFERNVLSGTRMMEIHDDFVAVARKFGFYSDDMIYQLSRDGTLSDCKVPEWVKSVFRSARDIAPPDHVKMQAAFARCVTSSVSKTINLPADARLSSVREAYLMAHELGCKGITVYRDGCRSEQPMALKKYGANLFVDPHSIPDVMAAVRMRHPSAWGTLHLHVSLERLPDGRYREREVFMTMGHSGDGVHSELVTFGRLASMLLRMGARLELVIEQLRGNTASQVRSPEGGHPTSISNEAATALLKYLMLTEDLRDADRILRQLPDMSPDASRAKRVAASGRANGFISRVMRESSTLGTHRVRCPTPDCAGELIYAEGCNVCSVCGNSRCL